MKKKTNENEFIIKKDERVKKLQAQIIWFTDEALYLSKKNKTYEDSLKQYQDKIKDLEEDK